MFPKDDKTFIIDHPDIDRPLPFDAIFDPARPVEVDIGCGKGRFLIAHARNHPETQFLGIERQLDRVRSVNKKAVLNNLQNVRVLRLEAAFSLAWMLPEERIQTFYLFFPDPWPKKRHHKRRLVAPGFDELVRTRLVKGGTIQMATDHLPYHEEMLALFRANPAFREISPMDRSPEEQTDFELIFRGQGLPIGASAFQKN